MGIAIAPMPNPEDTLQWSSSDNTLQVGGRQVGWADFSSTWLPANTYQYSYWYPSPRPNATEMAFKIVAKLMEDGLIEELTVKKFVKLVDDVAHIVKES